MEHLKKYISDLQADTIKVIKPLSRILMSNTSQSAIEKEIDDYLCGLETLCVKSRNMLEGFKINDVISLEYEADSIVSEIAGSVDVTTEGWLHIRLNTLLPSCKYKVSNYIGDTITRLLKNCSFELPYFESAFLAVVEHCNMDKHNSLDNDNKAWKMIPNSLKGIVIEDDSQFVLSIGLFAKKSEDLSCDIYVLPPEDAAFFMNFLEQNIV